MSVPKRGELELKGDGRIGLLLIDPKPGSGALCASGGGDIRYCCRRHARASNNRLSKLEMRAYQDVLSRRPRRRNVVRVLHRSEIRLQCDA